MGVLTWIFIYLFIYYWCKRNKYSLFFFWGETLKFIWIVHCNIGYKANMLILLLWGGEHDKPSGSTCNNGTKCSCSHLNFIIMGSLFSLPLHFFSCFACVCRWLFFWTWIRKKSCPSLFIQGSSSQNMLLKCVACSYYK